MTLSNGHLTPLDHSSSMPRVLVPTHINRPTRLSLPNTNNSPTRKDYPSPPYRAHIQFGETEVEKSMLDLPPLRVLERERRGSVQLPVLGFGMEGGTEDRRHSFSDPLMYATMNRSDRPSPDSMLSVHHGRDGRRQSITEPHLHKISSRGRLQPLSPSSTDAYVPMSGQIPPPPPSLPKITEEEYGSPQPSLAVHTDPPRRLSVDSMLSSPSTSPVPQMPRRASVHHHIQTNALHPYSRSPQLRVVHKLAERKRRSEMKELFDELKDALPGDMFRGSKASKWEVLSKAVDYIESLEKVARDRDAIVQERDALQREVEMLRGEARRG
ncbi:uncharacterized protein SPPG_01844 [Spizellomyces punctatus DAOM BR117]|uniref:BHLH domain-containing protein n=1 Tax=Spizellomyces punctatus (strain DAOM BR117) TaxID=645134 RepID=A0A0L0HNT9_SPIPD|nr:uncharacterized protein SPPG_01844 [Spizellomyces punctatus DAOM BR117]KND02762.1 hypothetical protein SPPG_01844 [Spizellomyces punctatus DAOM BR117]|eukprot:XP_016610801.1 hypothetical protein SPPG_01844 [Spizellomyces punctatus DAOM BR117]